MKIPFTKKELLIPSMSVGKNPSVDWALIFGVNMLLIVAFFYFGYTVYTNTSSIDNSIDFSASPSRKDELSVSDFSNIIRKFEEKKVTSDAIKSGLIKTPSPYVQE